MSSTQLSPERVTAVPTAATVDLKLEVIVIPVADVDRSKRFYEGLGWRVDADFSNGDDWRLVQLTPPGSACSVMLATSPSSRVVGLLQMARNWRPCSGMQTICLEKRPTSSRISAPWNSSTAAASGR